MNASLLSLETADQPVVGLDAWVDGNGVIRMIEPHCLGTASPNNHYGTQATEG